MTQKKKNNIIIGSLCAVVLLMVVGYAAFNTVLNINGTAKIDSTWNVLITNVTEGQKTVGATTKDKSSGQNTSQCKNTLCNPTWSDLTASFEVDLVSPGDSIEYEITVSNNGSINAQLDKITLSNPNSEYISFTATIVGEELTTGENTTFSDNAKILNAGQSKVVKVKVEFKNVTIDKIVPSTASLTVTLDYSQYTGSSSGGTVTPEEPEPFTGTGTVYRKTNDTLAANASIESKDYKTDPSELGSYYLKHEVENYLIKKSYVCFKINGTGPEQCMTNNDYENSKALLQSLKSQFSSCTSSSSYFICYGGGFTQMGATSPGRVNVESDGVSCRVESSGISNCSGQ